MSNSTSVSHFIITKDGYGENGGLPPIMKGLMAKYKYRVGNSTRCMRPGFLPFRNDTGKVYKSAYGELRLTQKGPTPTNPLILVVLHDLAFTKILATAVLFFGNAVVKLEYLCARKGAGYGSKLMEHILEMDWVEIGKKYNLKPVPREIGGPAYIHLVLENNSNKPGFYNKFGFIDTKRKTVLHSVSGSMNFHDNDEFDNAYTEERNTKRRRDNSENISIISHDTNNILRDSSSNSLSSVGTRTSTHSEKNMMNRNARILEKIVHSVSNTPTSKRRKTIRQK